MTASYRIAEVAERTGTSPGTLRYYERIGVLPAPARSANGYRVYDDRTLERLAFVTRAKQLGCTLDEIADLSVAWDGGECGPLQARLRELVAEKEQDARSAAAASSMLAAELRAAATALERHRPEGRCDDRCGCVSPATDDVDADDVIERGAPAGDATARDSAEQAGDATNRDVAVACTLGSGAVADRVAEWKALISPGPSAPWDVESTAIPSGRRLTFHGTVDVVEVVRLATAEHDCCRFFEFAVTIDHRGVALEVTAPSDATAVLDALFGDAAERSEAIARPN